MRGMAILLAFHLVGAILHESFQVPLPGNVIGLILFTAALFAKIVKVEWVEESAQFLLKHMMLFFAPIIVGTITFASVISENWLPIALSLVVGSLLTLLVTGWVTAKWSGEEDQVHGRE